MDLRFKRWSLAGRSQDARSGAPAQELPPFVRLRTPPPPRNPARPPCRPLPGRHRAPPEPRSPIPPPATGRTASYPQGPAGGGHHRPHQPSPGSGSGPALAVRIAGDITAERLNLLQEADDICTAEIQAAGAHETLCQTFAVLLQLKSVGVMGDLDHQPKRRISNRIINKVRGIHCVVLEVSSLLVTIEWILR